MFVLYAFPMRYESLKQIDEAGLNVRVWCFKCARGDTMDAIVWMLFAERGWPQELPQAAVKFRCKGCKTSEHVLVIPATRAVVEELPWDRQVVKWFHDNRKGKRLFQVVHSKRR